MNRLMRMQLRQMFNIQEAIASIEATSTCTVVGYKIVDDEIEFEIEEGVKPDPYADLGFTSDFSFRGRGAYQPRIKNERRQRH